MAGCPELINATIAGTTDTWGSVDRSALKDFEIISCLRPDTGAALLPWVYTMIAMIIHVPVVFVRATRWDIVQVWCICSTIFVIIVYVLAYISTNFATDQILTWTPLVLIIDAGSMLQIFFLVLETRPVRVGNRIFLFDPADAKVEQAHKLIDIAPAPETETGNNNIENAPAGHETQNGNNQAAPAGAEQVRNRQDPALYSAIAAAVFFFIVIVLQLLGLHAAAVAIKRGKSPVVSWCSPSFQPFGIAIVDGDCHVYQIDQSTSRGIGCIRIPGVWERQWLIGTIVGTVMSLVFEFMDLFILYQVDSTQKWRGVKMKRPWTTMICGVVMFGITLFYGLQYASMLPPGVTERVTIAVNVNGTKAFTAKLTSSGLRGTIIGWNDGIFESWKGTYTGSTANRAVS